MHLLPKNLHFLKTPIISAALDVLSAVKKLGNLRYQSGIKIAGAVGGKGLMQKIVVVG